MSLVADIKLASEAFEHHAALCQRCSNVDLEKSATFVEACPHGSSLIREYLHLDASRLNKNKNARQRRQHVKLVDNNKTTKQKAKELMRYK